MLPFTSQLHFRDITDAQNKNLQHCKAPKMDSPGVVQVTAKVE